MSRAGPTSDAHPAAGPLERRGPASSASEARLHEAGAGCPDQDREEGAGKGDPPSGLAAGEADDGPDDRADEDGGRCSESYQPTDRHQTGIALVRIAAVRHHREKQGQESEECESDDADDHQDDRDDQVCDLAT